MKLQRSHTIYVIYDYLFNEPNAFGIGCQYVNLGADAEQSERDYEPIPLNAVVVKTWNNQTPPVDKQVIFVTNRGGNDPFVAFDRHDERGLIENNLFRETKQGWYLEDPLPQFLDMPYVSA